ncbi:hypothetical protein SFB1_087G1 [Candidatus Arthromitus sp. SFB-1]|nr:hypothetical protein SFB1_087G1 [Candidatus Arthromitus sp. SFB-1]
MEKINNDRICVGLAGFGLSGRFFQAPFLHSDTRFNLKKVYERTSNNSKQEYPEVEIVRSFEELLTTDIDLVVISTPNPYHVSMASQAMKAGKHVFVEKPIASTSKEARELCEIAKNEKVLLSVYQNRRFDGDFLTVKKIIDENLIGEILDYECHFDRFVTGKSKKQWKADGGKGIDLLYDIGVHLIDQAYSIFGMPDEVYADLRKQRDESSGIDNFQVYLYYKDKKITLSAGRERRIGWLDTVILKHGKRVSGITNLAVTLLDVLTGFDKLKICVAYNLDGKKIEFIPSTIEEFSRCEPIYIELDGWMEDITQIKSFDDLPDNAKKYIKTIELTTGIKISIISVGPNRNQTIEI